MKHDHLCAIAHNFADSMASGLGFVVGYCPIEVFEEASASPGGVIEIDILRGRVVKGPGSHDLRRAAAVFGQGFPAFCEKNGAEVTDFRSFLATFDARGGGRRSMLAVADINGRRSLTEYEGVPLKRLKILDPLGRIRRKTRKIEEA